MASSSELPSSWEISSSVVDASTMPLGSSTSYLKPSYRDAVFGRTMIAAPSQGLRVIKSTIRPKASGEFRNGGKSATELKQPTESILSVRKTFETDVDMDAEVSERLRLDRAVTCSKKTQEILQYYADDKLPKASFFSWHERSTKYPTPKWFNWEEVYEKREEMIANTIGLGTLGTADWDEIDVPQVRLMREFSRDVYNLHQRRLPKLPDHFMSLINEVLDAKKVLSVPWEKTSSEYEKLISYGLDKAACLEHTNIEVQKPSWKRIGNISKGARHLHELKPAPIGVVDNTHSSREEEVLLESGLSHTESTSTSPIRSPKKINARTAPYSRFCSSEKSKRHGSTKEESANRQSKYVEGPIYGASFKTFQTR